MAIRNYLDDGRFVFPLPGGEPCPESPPFEVVAPYEEHPQKTDLPSFLSDQDQVDSGTKLDIIVPEKLVSLYLYSASIANKRLQEDRYRITICDSGKNIDPEGEISSVRLQLESRVPDNGKPFNAVVYQMRYADTT